jgi:hypothetical protein
MLVTDYPRSTTQVVSLLAIILPKGLLYIVLIIVDWLILSCCSCGDYASGTNHTLPTNGYARQFSGVNTLSFQKHITSQEITSDGLKVLGPIVATLADCEGLDAHAQAVRVRLSTINR